MFRFADFWFSKFLESLSWISGLIVVVIVYYLLTESAPFLKPGLFFRLFTDQGWYPREQLFNLLPMLVGSAVIGIGSLLVVVPLGFLGALFCHYHSPSRIASLFRIMMQLLAGIPSVIFGLWGLVEIVPLINKWHAPGASVLAGLIIVGLMVLPTFFIIVDSGLHRVPTDQLRAADSMGLSHLQKLWLIILPNMKNTFFTSSVLSLGRALGETMAVVMVCGNIVQLPNSVFAPVRTLTANIALEMAYATGLHRSSLFMSGLILTLLIAALILLVYLKEGRPT